MIMEMQALLAEEASLFMLGRVADMMPNYTFPMAVDQGQRYRSFATSGTLASCLSGLWQVAIGAMGVSYLRPRVLMAEVPVSERFRARARWFWETEHGAKGHIDLNYFCRVNNGKIQVEMVAADLRMMENAPEPLALLFRRNC
ncbi:hypothetical protein [Tabrizicola sp.]|uniref:hypothetical protein n=1 Tax=Tabrizicola sp. TaxID=2005166 RepID=UPI003F340697